jgi:hypothetical protein
MGNRIMGALAHGCREFNWVREWEERSNELTNGISSFEFLLPMIWRVVNWSSESRMA